MIRTAMAIASGVAIALTVAQGCDQSGEADCIAAGGACQVPNPQCTMVGPQDCGQGGYCCLAEADAAPEGAADGAPAHRDAAGADAAADAERHDAAHD